MSNLAFKQPPEKSDYSTVNYSHPLENVFADTSYFVEQPFFQIFEEGYKVKGNNSDEIYSAFRRRRWARQFLARVIGVISLILCVVGSIFLGQSVTESREMAPVFFLLGIPVGLFALMLVTKALSPIRETFLHKGEQREGKPLMRITPSSGVFFFNREYFLMDHEGEKIASFKRPFLHSLLRIRWHAYDKDGDYLFTAIEDSLIKAILRRYLKLGRFIPLHFVLNKNGGKKFADFKKRFTVRDKYNLDHNPKAVASWIMIATTLVLDTGEER